MKNWRETLEKELQDPEFKMEWKASEIEYQKMRSLVRLNEYYHLIMNSKK
jgi:hypothetical protein